jgi:hypothetical protein
MDPLQQFLATTAASSAISTVVQQAIVASGHWFHERYGHHSPAVQQQVKANVTSYLEELVSRIHKVEAENDIMKQQVATMMSQLDIAMLMERALLAGAETSDRQRHATLATIVSERLRVETDSLPALTSAIAVDAVAHLSPRHLQILAFTYTVEWMRWPKPEWSVAPALLSTMELEWAALSLKPYEGLEFTARDLNHLESAGCLGARRAFLTPDLNSKLRIATSPDFEYMRFVETPSGARFQAIYEGKELNGTSLTSSGSLIGMYVADQLADRPSDVTRWESDRP